MNLITEETLKKAFENLTAGPNPQVFTLQKIQLESDWCSSGPIPFTKALHDIISLTEDPSMKILFSASFGSDRCLIDLITANLITISDIERLLEPRLKSTLAPTTSLSIAFVLESLLDDKNRR